MRFHGTAGVVLAASMLAAGAMTACSSQSRVPSIGYAIDNTITTYNGGTSAGAASGALAAFGRVLPGFGYTGPEGDTISDTDAGTANVVPGEALTVQYRLNPNGKYSDDVPTTCDDLVLAWAARSGRYTRPDDKGNPVPLFDAASTAGYSDIERVDCQPGSKDATVVFRAGRSDVDWRALFGAGDLMPAHIAAKAANVPGVVSVVQSGDQQAIERIANFWNTGWALTPGHLDLGLLPSAGPYRIESYSDEDGLILVANDKWWGNKAATPRIVIWPKNANPAAAVSSGSVQVVDVGTGSVPGLNLDGFTTTEAASPSTEQLILATAGVFDSPGARKAFGLCVPRSKLYDDLGHSGDRPATGLGSGVLNSRITGSDTLIYPGVSAAGVALSGGDVPGAQTALAGATPTVRIGYLGPDDRRAKTVAEIAEACKPAGITVQDAGSPDFTPNLLREGKVDAILAGTAARSGAAGSGSPTAALYALKTGSGTNYGNYTNARYNDIVDQLAVEPDPNKRLALSVEAENLLWGEMPSVPLFDQPRTVAFANGMHAAIANRTEAGSGWNMDRWVLQR